MSAKKIVLISTFPDIHAYGIRVLSAILKNSGFETNLIFLNAPFGAPYSEDVLKQVADISKDSLFVGISVMTNFFARAKQATIFLKKQLKVPVVWGGIHTAIRPEECLQYADVICIGEAENIIVPFSQNLASANSFSQMDNVWLRENGKIIKNKVAPLINNISDLPFPDYEYRNHFVIDRGRLLSMDLKSMEQYMGYAYQTLASRGCFYNCSYCANKFFDKNFGSANTMKIRSRKMEDVVKEFISIKKKLNYLRIFKIADDLFLALPKKEIETFCKLYEESGLRMPLDISGVHPLILSEDKFNLLIEVGLQYVRMGIQSGSERIRKLYGRHETNSKILESANIIGKYKSRLKSIHYDFIVDNPWETPEEIKESLRLLVQIPKPYKLNIFSLTLYPGTDLYTKAKNEGIINNEFSQVYNKHYHANVVISYYNALFKIISTYKLPRKYFTFLIENESTLSAKTIYFILIRGINLVVLSKRLIYLMKEATCDIVNGKFSRINKYIFVRSKVIN